MKRLLLFTLMYAGTAPAFAGANFPISSEGTVQITRSEIIPSEIFANTEGSIDQALKGQCEGRYPNGGGYSQLTSINFDKIEKLQAGYGYSVHFILTGECIVP